ncbi:MAG TPA: trypsin-like peptidase domain-containing protein [Acidimicrobiales bacterium]
MSDESSPLSAPRSPTSPTSPGADTADAPPAAASPAPPLPSGGAGHPPPDPGTAQAATTAPPAPTPPPGRGRRAVAVLTAAGLMLVSATGGALVALGLDDDDPAPAPARSSLDAAPTVDGDGTAPDEPLSQVAAAVLPSVVSIGFDAGGPTGGGSGIVLGEDGQILTNNHVVAPVAERGTLTVTFSDGTTADAEIVGRDPATDLAVIQADGVSGLTPATLGTSANLNVGDTVLAIGSPLGLDGSVTSGIVSAVGRSITLRSDQESPFGRPGGARGTAVIDAIQTDAAINPGNSGGALIDADGEVVGVNTAIASLAQGTTGQGGNIGVGFAIPIDTARDVAEQLVEDGTVTHAYLGVGIVDADTRSGALVGTVEDGQPAAEAGIEEGDVIVRVGDRDVAGAADLTAAIRSHSPGDTVEVAYVRDGDERTVDVTLGELPD